MSTRFMPLESNSRQQASPPAIKRNTWVIGWNWRLQVSRKEPSQFQSGFTQMLVDK